MFLQPDQIDVTNDSANGRRKQRMAKYPEIRDHREQLGWSVQDLIARLDGTVVSERSIRRLEDGFGIRAENTHKVFNAISKQFPEKLNREEHVIPVKD